MARMKVDIVGREATYTCLDLDAGMPMHSHEHGGEHHTRCDAGAIAVLVERRLHRLEAGSVLRFDSTLAHAIAPLTVGARFTNIGHVEQEEWHGEMEMAHMIVKGLR